MHKLVYCIETQNIRKTRLFLISRVFILLLLTARYFYNLLKRITILCSQ